MKRKHWTITADKFLTREQVDQLLDHITRERDLAIARGGSKQPIRDYYIIRTLLESGLRVFEFCNLNVGDHIGQKIIVRCGKGGKARTILLTRATHNLLKEWLTIRNRFELSDEAMSPLFPSRYQKRYTTRGVQCRIKIVFAAAGLPSHFSAHSLRHTYCSLLLATGKISLSIIRNCMGHSSISMTDRYSHAIADISDVDLYDQNRGKPNSPSLKKGSFGITSLRKNRNDLLMRFR